MALVDNLVAYYKLDESSGNAADATGNGFTLTNTNTVGFAAGALNNCADYGTANTNKYLRLSNNLGITGGAITISTWVKMRTEIASGVQNIVLQGDAGTDVNYSISYEYNAGTRRLAFNRQKQAVSNNFRYATATLGTSNWHHIVLRYTGSILSGWLDGTKVGADLTTTGNGAAAAVSDIILGSDQGQTGTNYLSAYQDETGIWSRSLSDAEIGELYNSGTPLDIYGGGGGYRFNPQIRTFAGL